MTSRTRQSLRRPAFTLNELLIVIAIIVLMLGLAVPAFNALSGSKSVEGATNQISAVLGQARAEAVGIQEVRGVMFFLDPATDRINMAIVHAAYTDTNNITYLDLVTDRDFVALPPGVGIQTVDNPTNQSTTAADDTYLGFNAVANIPSGSLSPASAISPAAGGVLFGGAILFDAYGKLISIPYGFHCSQAATSTANSSGTLTGMGSLLTTGAVGSSATGKDFFAGSATNPLCYGQFGFLAYDRNTYENCLTTGVTSTAKDEDFQFHGGTWAVGNPEFDRETWLSSNASIYVINRYNGTLVKGD